MGEIKLEHTMGDFWATRPRRRASDRKVAGVAAAIGRRYAIDPVLIRVAFVVATVFSGVGALLYLLGWLLLPAEGDESSAAESVAGRGRSSMSAALIIVLGLLLIPAAGVVFDRRGSGVLGLVVALGALLLLHRFRAALGEIPGSSGRVVTPPAAQATADPAAPGVTGKETAQQPVPPAWDPLGAAPFAWDLPEPAPASPPGALERGPRSKVTPITLGLALLTGGIALAFWPALSDAQVAALLLGVIGIGLVVGSLLRGGRGLIVIAVPLALVTWALQVAPASGFEVGEGRWHPITGIQVLPRYELAMGQGRLDLSDLRLVDGQPVTTNVAVGFGEAHVILPPNVDAQVSCDTQFGDVNCLGRTDSGHQARVDVPDNGPDGPGGGKLILTVQTGFGHIHVERGS